MIVVMVVGKGLGTFTGYVVQVGKIWTGWNGI